MRPLLFIICVFLLFSCTRNPSSQFDFLVGTWQIEGKEQFEVWEKEKENKLSAHSYKIQDNQKIMLETISIKMLGDLIVYEATVPDQNEGETVVFTLNPEIKAYYSFENSQHDFPKKIQYEPKSNNEIKITVLGDEGKGFSYTLIRQKTE